MGAHNFRYLGYFVLLILPFIQLGTSYYVSVFFLSFVFLFCISLFSPIKISSYYFLILCLGASIFLIKSLYLYFLNVDIAEVLLPIRELVCYIGLFFISNIMSRSVYLKKD